MKNISFLIQTIMKKNYKIKENIMKNISLLKIVFLSVITMFLFLNISYAEVIVDSTNWTVAFSADNSKDPFELYKKKGSKYVKVKAYTLLENNETFYFGIKRDSGSNFDSKKVNISVFGGSVDCDNTIKEAGTKIDNTHNQIRYNATATSTEYVCLTTYNSGTDQKQHYSIPDDATNSHLTRLIEASLKREIEEETGGLIQKSDIGTIDITKKGNSSEDYPVYHTTTSKTLNAGTRSFESSDDTRGIWIVQDQGLRFINTPFPSVYLLFEQRQDNGDYGCSGFVYTLSKPCILFFEELRTRHANSVAGGLWNGGFNDTIKAAIRYLQN